MLAIIILPLPQIAKPPSIVCFIHQTNLPQNLRTQKFEWLQRNKQDFLNFTWCLILFQVFGNVSQWGVLEMELLVVS